MFRYVLLALKGCAMGMADVVPGVSGGTIAFISGIYSELIESIKSFNPTALKLLGRFEFRKFWRHINGSFLFSVLLGIGIAIFSLARLMTYLLAHHPIEIWSFFFGLIVASAAFVARDIRKWNLTSLLGLLVGTALAFWITIASPTQTPNDWWFIMLSGAVAICAMILPGISAPSSCCCWENTNTFYRLSANSGWVSCCFSQSEPSPVSSVFAPAFVAAAQASRPDDLPAHGFHGRIAQ